MLVRQLKFSWRTSLLQLTTFIHKNSHEMAIIDKLKQGNTIADVLINIIYTLNCKFSPSVISN